jgi:hypothetical protein
MADEITIKVYLSVSKTGVPAITQSPGQKTITMTGTDLILATQSIGTSAENINKGEITTPGMCIMHNLDATNFVEIGHDETGSFVADVKIKAGEWNLFRLNQAVPQGKADTGAVLLEYLMLED